MSAIFELSLNSELLNNDELMQITGSSRKMDQVNWLVNNGWIHHKSKTGDAVVGRLYARLKLAGISPTGLIASEWKPDFSRLR